MKSTERTLCSGYNALNRGVLRGKANLKRLYHFSLKASARLQGVAEALDNKCVWEYACSPSGSESAQQPGPSHLEASISQVRRNFKDQKPDTKNVPHNSSSPLRPATLMPLSIGIQDRKDLIHDREPAGIKNSQCCVEDEVRSDEKLAAPRAKSFVLNSSPIVMRKELPLGHMGL
ncbi:hypothetical protein PQX77_010646 [Marasmius sp. AFHP31]|nr:hypothetical protein PQX77_010646 [Marasmius sp. AFHP31]